MRYNNNNLVLHFLASALLLAFTKCLIMEIGPISGLHRKCYSKQELMNIEKNVKKNPTDMSFLKKPEFKDLRLPKRGKRGGVLLKMRKRMHKLPLPSIILGNAQSVGNKCDELIGSCKYLSEYRNANLICLSETWLTEDQADPDIPGFSVFRRDRCSLTTGKSRGGGVCIFVNNKWCSNVTVKETFCHEDIELLSLALRPFYLPREFPQIFITVVYIHPRANYKSAANILSNVYHKLASQSPETPSFLLGDFNQCKLNSALPGLKQYVDVKTCGDNILDRCYGALKDAYQSRVLPNLGRSAHRMVQLIPRYVQQSRKDKPVVKTVKVWSQDSVDRLNACFDCTDWDTFMDDNLSIDQVTEVISDYIAFCTDSCVESKTIKLYPNNSKPWVNKDLVECFKERSNAIKENNEDQRKAVQKKIDNKIKEGKKKYKEKLQDNFEKGKSKDSWDNMNNITGYKPKKTGIHTDDERKLANDLNIFYKRFDNKDFSQEQNIALNKVNENLDIPLVTTVEEVKTQFSKINARSASGPDGVGSRTLKLCCDSLSGVYCTLFNRSFREGRVPKIWKTSTIVPVPKKKTVSQLNDYRPVALTSVPMKCAERIVLRKLREQTSHCQDSLQFAYTAKRNTQDAILTLLHSLYQHLDQPKTYARLLFIDFSSAFNTLQPHLLIDKLADAQVNPSIIKWVHSFMTDRPQQVRVGGATSNVLVTNTGAPQGCVLSPVLFTIYTADCRTNDPSLVQIKFADDTSLSGLITNSEETKYREAVTELVNWCDRHYLELNVTKTEEMIVDFRTRKEPIQPLVIKGEEVRQVSAYKYLGTTIDDKLDWTPNVDACLKKANQRLFFLRKLRQFKVSGTILHLFYRSVIQSILLYNQLCYFESAKAEDVERLEKVTKKAEKIIGQEVTSLKDIHECTCLEKAKGILNDSSHPLHDIIVSQKSKRGTERYLSFRCRTERFCKSFVPTAIRSLNNVHKRLT